MKEQDIHVLSLISGGSANKGIAAQLAISVDWIYNFE
jgi:hypothetical protein